MAPSRNYMTLQNLWQIEKMARDSRGMITYQTPLMPWVPDLISKAERDMTHVYQFFEADRAAHGGEGYAGYGFVKTGEPMLKSQDVRLLDVFLIGPLMIYAGTKLPKKHKVASGLMQMFGLATIIYNWKNWQTYREIMDG